MMERQGEFGGKGIRFASQMIDAAFFRRVPEWFATASDFELSLHTGVPQSPDGVLRNEIDYPGYARVVLPRSDAGWRRTDGRVSNAIGARFPLCQQGGRHLVTHWAMTPSGVNFPAYCGALDRPLAVEPGIRPVIDAGMIVIEEMFFS